MRMHLSEYILLLEVTWWGSRAPGVRMGARDRLGRAEREGPGGREGVLVSVVWAVRGGAGGHGRSG